MNWCCVVNMHGKCLVIFVCIGLVLPCVTAYQQCAAVATLDPFHVCDANTTSPGSSIAATIPSGCPPHSQTLVMGSGLITDCKCMAGYYGTVGVDGAETSCVACSDGSYSLAVDQPLSDTCIPCNAGQYCPSISASPVFCAPGTYSGVVMAWNSSVCIPFPAGYYGNITGATSMLQATACPAASYSSVIGATDVSVCQWCPVGQYCLDIGTDPAPCTNLPENAHYTGPGNLPTNCPWVCDPAYYLSENGTTCLPCNADNWCYANVQNQCPLNSQAVPLSSAQQACICKPGYYGDGSISGTSPCSQCWQGYYCEGGNLNMSVQCPENSTSPFGSVVLGQCQCLPGYVGDNGSACALCAPDTVCLSGQLSFCPLHSTAPAGTSSIESCVADPGYFQYSLGDVPVQCPESYYCTGGLVISRCVENAVSQLGSSSDLDCYCDRGYEGVNNSACVACQDGTWCWTGVLNVCPTNSNSPVLSSYPTNCTCNPGYFGQDGEACSPCLPGTVKATQGNASCVSCETGTSYQPAFAATECLMCTRCPDAQYASVLCMADADAVCSVCPDDHYCSGDAKDACPYPSISHNATTYLDCRCGEGSYGQVLSPTQAECSSCPVGAFCPAIVTTCSC